MNRESALALLEKSGCPENVIAHSEAVAEFALRIADCIPSCSSETAYTGGLLHDIGRSVSHGIDHGVTGGKIAHKAGVNSVFVRIIENHIGSGLTAEEAGSLGLPSRNFIPETIEEKVVAHADNLISGTKRRDLRSVIDKLKKKNMPEAALRMQSLHDELCRLAGTDIENLG